MKYQIWSEGYRATGQHEKAIMVWEGEAETFSEAVKKYYESTPDDNKHYFDLDEKRPSFWGCRLFDNEKEARASFG